jgi:hypothetical protein
MNFRIGIGRHFRMTHPHLVLFFPLTQVGAKNWLNIFVDDR